MHCTYCNLTGIDPRTRQICPQCNGTPEGEPVSSDETLVAKVKRVIRKKK